MTPRQRAQRRRNWLKRQRSKTRRTMKGTEPRAILHMTNAPNVRLKRSHLTMQELAIRLRTAARTHRHARNAHGRRGAALNYAMACKRLWMARYNSMLAHWGA